MVKKCLVTLLGSCILAFGLCHIHALSGVTEGGQLGLTLLLHHWLGPFGRGMEQTHFRGLCAPKPLYQRTSG